MLIGPQMSVWFPIVLDFLSIFFYNLIMCAWLVHMLNNGGSTVCRQRSYRTVLKTSLVLLSFRGHVPSYDTARCKCCRFCRRHPRWVVARFLLLKCFLYPPQIVLIILLWRSHLINFFSFLRELLHHFYQVTYILFAYFGWYATLI